MSKLIAGSGGFGKGGGGSSRTPSTAPDSLDSRQYANVIDLISEGEIEGLVQHNITLDGVPAVSNLPSIYLNNTQLQNLNGTYNFTDVEVFTRNGTQAQTYIPLSAGVEDEKPVSIPVVKDSPIVRTVTDVDVDAVRVTIAIPALQKINNKTGDTTGTSLELRIEVQYASGGFTTAITDTITGRTGDEYRKDYLITLTRPSPSDVVDIRVVRVTADSADALLSNSFTWYSYTEIVWAKLRYPNSALVGLRVNAEQFSSIPQRSYLVKGLKIAIPQGVTIDADTGRIIYPDNFVWDGTFAAATWTSCPAWILWDLLTSTRYGFGDHIDTSKLDKWAFFAASKYANELVSDGFGGLEARFSCNTNIQTAEDAYKLINDLLSVMRCQGYWSSGSMTVEQDRPEDPSYLFTAANVTAEGFSYSSSSLKTRPNVAVVSYLDLDLRDTAFEVVEDAEAVDKYGAVRTEISAFACTSRGQANRIGRWLIFSERYEKEVVTFASALEAGQQVRPGQIIQIADPVKAGARRAGRISSATTTTVTVDDSAQTDLSISAGSTLSVILPDGTVEARQVSTVAGTLLTVAAPFTAAPNSNSVWMLESPTLQSALYRVLSIAEQDGHIYSITAITHNPSKYDYIENGTPLQTRQTTPLNTIPPSPENLDILHTPTAGGGTTSEVQYELNGRIAIKITFTWLGPKAIKFFRVRYRFEDDNFTTVKVQGTSFDILDAKQGNYEIEVSSISASGVLYSAPALASYTVQGLNAPPVDVTGATGVAMSESLVLLTWNQSTELDVILGGKVIIRHDPRQIELAEWGASTQIVDAVAGRSTQKQVPLLPGTYFIKFQDYLGNKSTNAAAIEIALPNSESRKQLGLYVEQNYNVANYAGGVLWTEQSLLTPFSGTKTNCVYSGSETALIIDGTPYVAIDYVEPIYMIGELQGEYIFSETLDMGAVYDVLFRRYVLIRSVSSSILFDSASTLFDERTGLFDGATIDAVNVITYIRATNDDPAGTPVWGPWTELINASVQGRAFQCKAVISSNNDSVNIAVEELQVIPELMRRFTANTIPVLPGTITFSPAFYETNAITITPTTMLTNYSFVISNFSRTGFTTTFYQGTELVDQPYTYNVTGYGRAV